ncbi:MAG: succinate dehydrogenase, cytochrome b556 subunit [Betaproteobacteria bacterium]|nr:succinate dehydrogenase, cytochrome b556 subunit [Betaproteobacteria bacterium]
MNELTRRRAVRPRFLNLLRLRYPVGAVCSFAHRVSGVLLALFAPALVWLLRRSLEGPSGYEAVARVMHPFLAKAAALVFVWALAHHVLAGVRHLLKDIDRGSSLAVARRSAWTVNVLGVLILLLALGALA